MEQCTEHAHWYARHVRYAQELKDATAEWRQAREVPYNILTLNVFLIGGW
jgi:hypothetical protein